MTSVYGPAASHERRVKGLEQPGEDIARLRAGERSALLANLAAGFKTGAACRYWFARRASLSRARSPYALQSATKGALKLFVDALRIELRGTATGYTTVRQPA